MGGPWRSRSQPGRALEEQSLLSCPLRGACLGKLQGPFHLSSSDFLGRNMNGYTHILKLYFPNLINKKQVVALAQRGARRGLGQGRLMGL